MKIRVAGKVALASNLQLSARNILHPSFNLFRLQGFRFERPTAMHM